MALVLDTAAGDGAGPESPRQQQLAAPNGSGRQPPIIRTSSVNLPKFQGNIKAAAKGTFEFRTPQNDIRMLTMEMVDFSAVMNHLDTHNLNYY